MREARSSLHTHATPPGEVNLVLGGFLVNHGGRGKNPHLVRVKDWKTRKAPFLALIRFTGFTGSPIRDLVLLHQHGF